MVANRTDSNVTVGATELLDFAGDQVRLSGQIDYPEHRRPAQGYPLFFVIQHGTSTSRKDYQHICDLGMTVGAAVFRWDKRGTGKSGHGSRGSVEVDTLKAYAYALNLPSINPTSVIIFAQSEGTLILQQAYKQFEQLQIPLGIILAGNMLDEKAVLTIKTPIHIVISKKRLERLAYLW